jgi:SAM-dependent methyltransferase
LRDNSLCPHCKSLERHRLLWLYIRQHPHLFAGSPKVLHIAPEKIFTDLIRSFPGVDYLSADLNSPLAMVSMDITDIHYPENTFDAILCCHVLEHIPDDGRAMRELHRVLKPGGWAILQVPLELDRPHTYEDPMITDPAEREKHFNQRDHVRIYGRDYVHRLEASGFHVRQDDFGKAMPPALADRYRIDPNEPIFFCTKANAAS